MSVRVIYCTEALSRGTELKPASQCEQLFASVAEAKDMPFPPGCTFALLPVENGRYVYHSPKFGWEFQKDE